MITMPLVAEQTFETSVEKVWRALTDCEQMRRWYFDVDRFEPVEGFEFSFSGENEGRRFIHRCRISHSIPNKLLCYSWRYENEDGLSHVCFELFAEPERTRLRLTHKGLETFPQTKDFKRENFEAGWKHILSKSLKSFLQSAV